MNFAREIVDGADPARLALVERSRAGERREWSFGEVSAASTALSRRLVELGVGRGDVVMTLVGSRPEWVLAMVAAFRIGAIALPCNEQLRAGDLRARLAAASPRVVICDERNLNNLREADPQCQVLVVPDPSLFVEPAPSRSDPPRGHASAAAELAVDLGPRDPCLITFTSGTTGAPRGIVHGQRYLAGQRLQAQHWLGAAPGDLVWCTAATGWSKSARNAFIAPWLQGAAALLHDARFDPEERLRMLIEERVNVLCMAPTEYRLIAKRSTLARYPELRGLIAAGEALNPEVLDVWARATGIEIRDGYGQTETGQLTGMPPGAPARPGSMGRPLPGIKLEVIDGELVLLDPSTDPTFFVGYLGDNPVPEGEPWRTGDQVSVDSDGYLHFEGRADDLIISSGYRIGPFEVESALVSHAAVVEAAVVATPDEERGSLVRAVVVLGDGFLPGAALTAELQEHVRQQTAPYKYPRIIDFVAELPTTSSGKIRRALLRG